VGSRSLQRGGYCPGVQQQARFIDRLESFFSNAPHTGKGRRLGHTERPIALCDSGSSRNPFPAFLAGAKLKRISTRLENRPYRLRANSWQKKEVFRVPDRTLGHGPRFFSGPISKAFRISRHRQRPSNRGPRTNRDDAGKVIGPKHGLKNKGHQRAFFARDKACATSQRPIPERLKSARARSATVGAEGGPTKLGVFENDMQCQNGAGFYSR